MLCKPLAIDPTKGLMERYCLKESSKLLTSGRCWRGYLEDAEQSDVDWAKTNRSHYPSHYMWKCSSCMSPLLIAYPRRRVLSISFNAEGRRHHTEVRGSAVKWDGAFCHFLETLTSALRAFWKLIKPSCCLRWAVLVLCWHCLPENA